jgi:hypothetical protein
VTRNTRTVLLVIEAALACGTLTLAIITAIWPTWIETVFGVDPDKQSGSLEWLLVIVCSAIAITCGAAARYQWRQLKLRTLLLLSPRTGHRGPT